MIRTIKHKGLQRFYEAGDARGIGGNMRDRVKDILTILAAAHSIEEADTPGYRLHPLGGNVKERVELSQRTYLCEQCGLVVDRDLNAALNLAQYTL